MITGAEVGASGAARLLTLAGLICLAALPANAQQANQAQCAAPLEARNLEHAPTHFRERIAQGKPIKIGIIGLDT